MLEQDDSLLSWDNQHLIEFTRAAATEVFYWLDRGKEVDYVIRSGRSLVAFEVRSGTRRATPSGLAEFAKAFHPDRSSSTLLANMIDTS